MRKWIYLVVVSGGGGGGYSYAAGPILNGGIGGGGNGVRFVADATRQANTLPDGRNEFEAEAGVNGLGGGGGGAKNSGTGRPGGSGVVIIRIPGRPDTALQVAGTPDYIGTPDPAYGYVTNLAAGSMVSVSCGVTAVTNEAGTIAYSCTGWKLYDKDDNVLSTTRTTMSFRPAPTLPLLTFTLRLSHSASWSGSGGSLSPAQSPPVILVRFLRRTPLFMTATRQ